MRGERGRDLGVLDDLTNFLADQVGKPRVAVDVDGLVGPQLGQNVDQIALRPRLLEPLAALGIAQLPADGHLLRIWYAGQRPAGLLAIGSAVAFQQAEAIGRRRAVVGGQGKVRRALEDGQLGRLLGDQRDRLDAGRPRADHRDALAGEIDALMRPAAGEIDLALEILDAVDLRRLGRGETAGGHDVIAAGYAGTAVGLEQPASGRFIPVRRGHLGVEADIRPQVVAIGNEAEIAQDFGLGRVLLRPFPFALQLGIERVAVVDGLNVAACAGIPVPVPGAADVAGFFQHQRRQAGLAQSMQKIQAGKSGPDDCDVNLMRRTAVCRFRR